MIGKYGLYCTIQVSNKAALRGSFVYNLSMLKDLSRQDQHYLVLMSLLLLPPALFALGVTAGILLNTDSLTFALVGRPGSDSVRSFLFVLLCPLVAAGVGVHYLRRNEHIHELMGFVSRLVIAGSGCYLVVVLGYLLLENV